MAITKIASRGLTGNSYAKDAIKIIEEYNPMEFKFDKNKKSQKHKLTLKDINKIKAFI